MLLVYYRVFFSCNCHLKGYDSSLGQETKNQGNFFVNKTAESNILSSNARSERQEVSYQVQLTHCTTDLKRQQWIFFLPTNASVPKL